MFPDFSQRAEDTVSQADAWAAVAAQTGARFTYGGPLSGCVLQASTDAWILTLDTWLAPGADPSQTATRIRAPFFNPEGLAFSYDQAQVVPMLLYRLLGLESLGLDAVSLRGFPTIRSNNPTMTSELFRLPTVAPWFATLPAISIGIRRDEGILGPRFPEGMDELIGLVPGVMRKSEPIAALFGLFQGMLHGIDELRRRGRPLEDVVWERVCYPRTQIRQGDLLLWDGANARREAARQLTELRGPGTEARLGKLLSDEDESIRVAALEALGNADTPEATAALVKALGSQFRARGWLVSDQAATRLRAMGREDLVDAYGLLLREPTQGAAAVPPGYRPALIQALRGALVGGTAVGPAAAALAELGDVESSRTIRELLRARVTRDPRTRAMLGAAVERLDKRQSLPLPADSPGRDGSDLPRPSGPAGFLSRFLPRPASGPDDDGAGD